MCHLRLDSSVFERASGPDPEVQELSTERGQKCKLKAVTQPAHWAV